MTASSPIYNGIMTNQALLQSIDALNDLNYQSHLTKIIGSSCIVGVVSVVAISVFGKLAVLCSFVPLTIATVAYLSLDTTNIDDFFEKIKLYRRDFLEISVTIGTVALVTLNSSLSTKMLLQGSAFACIALYSILKIQEWKIHKFEMFLHMHGIDISDRKRYWSKTTDEGQIFQINHANYCSFPLLEVLRTK